jgi:hypothetical protein
MLEARAIKPQNHRVSRGYNASSTDSSFASAQVLDARVCGEVGARLDATREQLKLTHADVANRLLLSTAQVHGLERADATAFHNPAFFAAALRKYATLMAIDCPEAILTPKSPPSVRPASNRESMAAARSGSKPSRSSVPMEWLAVVAIVVLTGAGLAWYFGGRTSPPVDGAAQSRATLPAPPEPFDGAEPSLLLSVPATSAALPDELPAPAPVPVNPPAPAPPAGVSAGGAGVVTLARPAWVFVRYGDNSVIERTLQAGQSLTLTSAPIYLAIGAGDGVTLTIRQRPIDVSPFRNGDEIRIGSSDLAALAR